MPTALLAFDKFKDSLTAAQACALAEAGITATAASWQCVHAPLTDGGEGFAEILTTTANGTLHTAQVHGPLKKEHGGGNVGATWGLVGVDNIPPPAQALLGLNKAQTNLAVIEMAQAAGLEAVPQPKRHPANCTTYGVGQLLLAAQAAGAHAILLGIGGSATNDGGAGALQAIENAQESFNLPIIIACDVDNPLLGPTGATYTYGPQKGLKETELPEADAAMAAFAKALCTAQGQAFSLTQTPGAGAAGGISFGLMCALGARLTPGFPLVSAWLNLNTHLKKADAVLTGEGRFDASSLQGKGPYTLVELAAKAGVPSALLCGAAMAELPEALVSAGAQVTPLSNPAQSLAENIAAEGERLKDAAGAFIEGLAE